MRKAERHLQLLLQLVERIDVILLCQELRSFVQVLLRVLDFLLDVSLVGRLGSLEQLSSANLLCHCGQILLCRKRSQLIGLLCLRDRLLRDELLQHGVQLCYFLHSLRILDLGAIHSHVALAVNELLELLLQVDLVLHLLLRALGLLRGDDLL